MNKMMTAPESWDAAKAWHPASEPPENDRRVLLEVMSNGMRKHTSATYEPRGDSAPYHYHWYDYEMNGVYIRDGAAIRWCELPPMPERSDA